MKMLNSNNLRAFGPHKKTIQSNLHEMAMASGPHAKLPTKRELSQRFGASEKTIHDVLNELESINVLYRRQGSGIYVSDKIFQKNIALVAGTIFRHVEDSPFWDALWRRFILEAEKRRQFQNENFSVHVILRKAGILQPLDDKIARLVESGQIDGILGVGLDFDTLEWLEGHKIPVVSFAGNGTWHIIADTLGLIRMGVEHLAAKGCKTIRLWTPGNYVEPTPRPPFESPDEADLAIYRETMRASGLECDDSLVWSNRYTENAKYSNIAQGKLMMERWLREGGAQQREGIILADDLLALGALHALDRANGWERVEIISHANKGTPVLYAYEDKISRLEFDPAAIVVSMFSRLDSIFANEDIENYAKFVSPSLIPAIESY